jgi:hypothetical protein
MFICSYILLYMQQQTTIQETQSSQVDNETQHQATVQATQFDT